MVARAWANLMNICFLLEMTDNRGLTQPNQRIIHVSAYVTVVIGRFNLYYYAYTITIKPRSYKITQDTFPNTQVINTGPQVLSTRHHGSYQTPLEPFLRVLIDVSARSARKFNKFAPKKA